MLCFLLYEIIQGYRAIKQMTDAQVEKFHLQRFNEDLEMESLEMNTRTLDGVRESKKVN